PSVLLLPSSAASSTTPHTRLSHTLPLDHPPLYRRSICSRFPDSARHPCRLHLPTYITFILGAVYDGAFNRALTRLQKEKQKSGQRDHSLPRHLQLSPFVMES